MDEERTFYCEEAERNCPFVSRFRYCSCCELRLGVDDPKEKLVEVLSKHTPYGYGTLCLIAEELMDEGVLTPTLKNEMEAKRCLKRKRKHTL